MDIKSFFEQYKYYLAGISAGVIILVLFVFSSVAEPKETVSFDFEAQEEPVQEETVPGESPAVTTIFVEVKGAVISPGVYELPVDARVKNVLDVAVLSENAELLTVNQSAKLTDEMVIYVPYEGEIDPDSVVSGITADTAGEASGELVNINTAGISELTTLSGIGEKKAQAILTYREEQGLFTALEELKNIPGIGDKTFENLKPYITIN